MNIQQIFDEYLKYVTNITEIFIEYSLNINMSRGIFIEYLRPNATPEPIYQLFLQKSIKIDVKSV